MPLQNNDVLLVNRGGESHRYSFENLKRDVLSDIELQLTGLEWVARNPTGATEISALANTASTPRDWDTVDVLLFGPGNDLSEVTLGATVLLTNVTSGRTGTYDVVGVNPTTRQIDVTYISDTGGDISEGNTFQVAVLSLGVSGVQISDTAPEGAQQGQLWWNTDDGRLYVFYEDGDTSQWVDASPDTLVDQHWQRDDATTTLSPQVAGDSVDLGTGDISATDATLTGDLSAANGTFSGKLSCGASAGQDALSVSDAAGDVVFTVNGDTGQTHIGDQNPIVHVSDGPNALYITEDSATGQRVRIHNNAQLDDTCFNTLTIGAPSARPSGIVRADIGLYQSDNASLAGYPVGYINIPHYQSSQGQYVWFSSDAVMRTSNDFQLIGRQAGTVIGPTTSDLRLKQNIVNCPYGLAEVKQLQPKTFEFKAAPGVSHAGFIAQEVKDIIPEAVYDTNEKIGDGDETKLGMHYIELIPALVNAIKELEAEVQQLKGGN